MSEAGDAGRGFAVVANEVKALASQTSEATDNISKQIHLVTSTIGQTIEGLQTTSSVLKEINDISKQVETSMETQTELAQTMGSGLKQLSVDANSAKSSASQIKQLSMSTENWAKGIHDEVTQMRQLSYSLSEKIAYFVNQLQQRG